MFGRIQLYLAAGVVALAAVWGYGKIQYEDGRSDMKRDIALAAAAARIDNIEEAERLKNEVDALDNDEFLDRLSDWVLAPGGG